MLFILNLNIASKHEMREVIKTTLDDYIDHYPQKRLQGKTCGQLKKELLELSEHTDHPIVQANRYKKYWDDIGSKKRHRLEQIAAEIKKQPSPLWIGEVNPPVGCPTFWVHFIGLINRRDFIYFLCLLD